MTSGHPSHSVVGSSLRRIIRRPWLLAVVACGLVSGCAGRSVFRAAVSPVERSVFMVEHDDNDKAHALSSKSSNGDGVERVPAPAQVDVNSTISIEVRPAAVPTARQNVALRMEAMALTSRADTLRGVLRALAEDISVYQEALEAFQATQTVGPSTPEKSRAIEVFVPLAQRADAAEADLLDRMQAAWPEGARGFAKAETALLKIDTRPELLNEVIQSELDALNTQTRELIGRVQASGYSIRLEAFLQPRDKAPVAIHLEGYDQLDQQMVQRLDRFGLDLSPSESAALQDLARASKELADAAERVRSGQASFRDAFSNLQSDAAKQIAGLVQEADSLRAELEKKALQDRARALETSLSVFRDSLRVRLPAAVQSHADSLVNVAKAGIATLTASSEKWRGALESLVGLSALAPPNSSPDALIGWVTGIRSTASSVAQALGDPRPVANAFAKTRSELDRLAAGLGSEGRAIVEKQWSASGSAGRVDELRKLVERVVLVENTVAYAFQGFTQVPSVTDIVVPGRIDIPLESAPSTAIEIQRTPRVPRDRITLRASLVRGDQVTSSSVATFQVLHLGWSAELAPSVVVLRPDRLEGGSTSGRFAPAVAYLVHYNPRDESRGVFERVCGTLQPAFGFHAAFLSYRPEAQNDIGLGLSAGVWDGLGQAGIGLNLFEPRRAKGGLYYYVGSSLIPLLQRLGQSTATESSH